MLLLMLLLLYFISTGFRFKSDFLRISGDIGTELFLVGESESDCGDGIENERTCTCLTGDNENDDRIFDIAEEEFLSFW